MWWAPVTGRRHIDLARIGLGISDELGNGLSRNRRIDPHDALRRNGAGARRIGGDKIEVGVVIERRFNWFGRAGKEERIAVGGRPPARLSPDIAACARSVLDNELLTEPLR